MKTTTKEESGRPVTGLVLGGGGARGCYEVGAWQAFRECQIRFDCVAGTSIGAIVGAIYVQNTLEPLVQFVYEMKPASIAADMFAMPESFQDIKDNREELHAFFHKYFRKGTDISPLKEALHKMFDYEKFMADPVNYACMTYNVTRMQAEPFFKKDMTKENAETIILASASCYPAFPMMKMGDEYYVDGGYGDNLPVKLCQQMGATQITAIDVHGPGRNHPVEANVRYMEPILKLNNFLDFRQEAAVRSMRIGYLETMKRFDKFCGYIYTFVKDDWPRIYMISQYLDMHLKDYGILPSQEEARQLFSTYYGYVPTALITKYTEDYAGGEYIEALAACAGVEPVKLYSYDIFLDTLNEKLEAIPALRQPKNVRDSLKVLQNGSRQEVVNFLHAAMVHNRGRLPLSLSPLKAMFEHEYILAAVWYCLGKYL